MEAALVCNYEMSYFDHPMYRMALSTMYSTTALTATILNSLILISIWKTPSLHKPSYILIGSLALSDLLNGAIAEPLMAMNHIAALKAWQLNKTCQISSVARGTGYWTGAVSLYTLTVISVDRLLAIILRNRYRSVVTLKRVTTLLLVWWIGTFILSVSVFVNFEVKLVKDLLLFVGTCIFILLSTITVSYAMAFHSLKKITSSVSPNVANEEASTPSPNIDVTKYRKSLRTMLLVFVFMVVFYIPYLSMAIAFVAEIILHPEKTGQKKIDVLYICFMTTEFVLLTNSTMNPLLYLWRMQDIREAVKTTVKRIFSHGYPGHDVHT
jgi:hypothetical protein